MNELPGIQAVHRFTEQYVALRAQYPQLPNLDELDDTFDVRDGVERERITTSRPMRLAISMSLRWINGWTGTLHDLLLPNQQNAIAMQEASAMTDDDRRHVHEVLDWIMYRNRTWTSLLVTRDDAAEVAFLTDLTQEWIARRARLAAILTKVRRVWEDRMRGIERADDRPNYTG